MTGTQLFQVKWIYMTRGAKLTIWEINKEEIITQQLPEGVEDNQTWLWATIRDNRKWIKHMETR